MKKLYLLSFIIMAAGCSQLFGHQNNCEAGSATRGYSNSNSNYAIQYSSCYVLRSFDDYGNDVPATPTAQRVGVKDLNGDFIFTVSEDSQIPNLSSDSVRNQLPKDANSSNYIITPAQVAGQPALKEAYNGDDRSITSVIYYVQTPNGRILDIIVKNHDLEGSRILASFYFWNK